MIVAIYGFTRRDVVVKFMQAYLFMWMMTIPLGRWKINVGRYKLGGDILAHDWGLNMPIGRFISHYNHHYHVQLR